MPKIEKKLKQITEKMDFFFQFLGDFSSEFFPNLLLHFGCFACFACFDYIFWGKFRLKINQKLKKKKKKKNQHFFSNLLQFFSQFLAFLDDF